MIFNSLFSRLSNLPPFALCVLYKDEIRVLMKNILFNNLNYRFGWKMVSYSYSSASKNNDDSGMMVE